MVTLSSFAMFGVLGLAVDLGWAYYVRTSASAAADAAALAAVQAANQAVLSGAGYVCGNNGITCYANPTACPSLPPTTPTSTIGNGCLYAQANGFRASGNQNVTMQSGVGSAPPTVAGLQHVQYWVTARVSQRIPQLFSAISGHRNAVVTARSTAAVMSAYGGGCVYGLKPSGSGGVVASGTTTVNAPCGIFVNSNDPRAMQVNGIACVNTGSNPIQVVGGYTASNGCISPAPTIGVAPITDPLATLIQPAFPASCNYTNTNLSAAVQTLNPGVYCGGITITSSIVTFNPGTYILIGGGLVASSAGTVLTGSDVTFYNTACGAGLSHPACPPGSANYDGSYHPMQLSGNLTYTLSAPTSGPYNNILFMQDRTLPLQTGTESISGGVSGGFTGVAYFPRSRLAFAGGTVTNSMSMSLVAWSVSFVGNAYLRDGLNAPGGVGTGAQLALIE